VLVSPYYSDNFTEKPREIDIIAERHFSVSDPGLGFFGHIAVRLFIECKYVAGTTVFWFDAKDVDRAAERVTRDTGWEDPRRTGIGKTHHHLAAVPVAKLVASEGSRSDDYEAISRAINQNLNALVYYRLHTRPLALGNEHRIKQLGRLLYPLIVVNAFDNFYATDLSTAATPIPITQPFQLEVNYAYTDRDRNGLNEYFLIDVVNIDGLQAFLSNLEESDVGAMSHAISLLRR
ncbi:MAG: hypothetical protein ACHQPH_03085, partial [Reyranellales bacterium]